MRHPLILATAFAMAAPVSTQGFGLFEHGACMMGRAGAGIAAPCTDGSGIFFNPAGLTGQRGLTLSVGGVAIKAMGGFTDDVTATETRLQNGVVSVPHAYLAYGITDRITAGLGMFVPFGLGTAWPDTFEGRYVGYDNGLNSIYVQPTVSVRLHPMLAVGGGPNLIMSSVHLSQRVELSALPIGDGVTFGNLGLPPNIDMADARIEATGNGLAGHVALLFTPHARVSVGARYLTPARLDYTGTIDFTQIPTNITLPPFNPLSLALDPLVNPANPLPLDIVLSTVFQAGQPLADGDVTTSVTMPGQVVAGIAVRATNTVSVFADWQMVRWSAFDTLRADFPSNAATPPLIAPQDFNDSHGLRLAVEWLTSGTVALRSGFIWHSAASPDQTVTPLLPEGERNEWIVGLGYQVFPGLTADVAYQFLRQERRRGRVRSAPEHTGLYDFNAHMAGLSLTARF